jgi:uncharacterized protein (DUF697 family)
MIEIKLGKEAEVPAKTERDKKVKQEEPENLKDDPQEVAAEKMMLASDIVRRKMYYSVGVGLVPVPLVDMAALLGMQIYMIKQLADVFETPFSQSRVRSILLSLMGSVLPVGLAAPLASGLKLLPIVGYTTSALALSATCGAATYALGKIFTNHFAMGGTVFDFDSDRMREAFAKRFKEGQDVAAEMKAEA